MNAEEWTKDGAVVLFGFIHLHRLREALQGNVEELLNYLVAGNSLLGLKRRTYQLRRPARFGHGASIKRIDEDIGVEKESIAHSVHLC